MHQLELKIPPPLVALVIAFGMWLMSHYVPIVPLAFAIRVALTIVIAAIGAAFSISGGTAFRKAKTTVNPMTPNKASSLVTSGVYRITRNPMYVGLLLALVAWAMLLDSLYLLLGPVLFVAYISRFQIAPEERILLGLFGDEYSSYMARVRRWL